MKLSIERNALMKALGHVQNVVERRNTIPILSNVLMSAEGDTVSLVATDLDIEMSEATGADVSQPGQITAPAHTLYDIVRKLSDGAQVVLQINAEERLDIDAGRAHFTLPLLPSLIRHGLPSQPKKHVITSMEFMSMPMPVNYAPLQRMDIV